MRIGYVLGRIVLICMCIHYWLINGFIVEVNLFQNQNGRGYA